MKKEFNTRPLTRLARTWAEVIGAEAPALSDKETVTELLDLVAQKTENGKVDRMLIYNPDAVGQWVFEKYRSKFADVEAHTDLQVDYITEMPPKTPVCFATMFSGVHPEVHGIQRYTKPQLTIDTLFDSWVRSGKKVAMVAVANQSIPRIFAGRNIDYYLLPYDGEVVEKALELIALNQYDIIEVYNQEYDDSMHLTHPKSKRALRALDHYNDSYRRLCEAVDEHWGAHDTLVSFSTDHGVHRAFYGLGQHGSDITKDRNIVHFYGVKSKKK